MTVLPSLVAFVSGSVSGPVPTGSDPATVDRFFDWLYTAYLTRHPNSPIRPANNFVIRSLPQWKLEWGGAFMQLFVTGAILIAFFFLFAWRFNRTRRPGANLYRPTSYGGALTEVMGEPALFSVAVWIGLILWAVYYAVEHVLMGQVY